MTATIFYSYIDSPLGQLFARGDGQFVTALFMPEQKGGQGPDTSWQQRDDTFGTVREQLGEYFAGERQAFDLPIKAAGTLFQQRVWRELLRIPFGTTISYAQLAQRLGQPTATRTVGNANSRNPVSIIVPCHRVIGCDGKLTGYAGGIANKQWLIDWEQECTLACVAGPAFSSPQR